MARMPAAEVDVTPELVRTLLEDQHPDLSDLPISMFANGWDNAMLRLGEDLLVRVPRRELAAELVEHEQAWLPLLAPRLPAAIPAPVRVGRPACGYPWSWSVPTTGAVSDTAWRLEPDGTFEMLGVTITDAQLWLGADYLGVYYVATGSFSGVGATTSNTFTQWGDPVDIPEPGA